eukprot:PLAT6215.1.p1 GENE.PLAT6215.1~~PLAT6215.1.p1  ORF type:complete len:440 (+),score=246.99 PLAT6215.1:37-1320(+)
MAEEERKSGVAGEGGGDGGDGESSDVKAEGSDAGEKEPVVRPPGLAVEGLFEALAAERRAMEARDTSAGIERERYVFLLGSGSSGKTALLSHFLAPGKPFEPGRSRATVGLDYTFGRRAASSTAGGQLLAHIWELGGGKHTQDLMNVPITPQRLPKLGIVVVADTSQPERMLPALNTMLAQIRRRCDACLQQLQRSKPATADAMVERAAARWAEHEDGAWVQPLPVPLLIVGAKWDVLKDSDTLKRKAVNNALRFIALANGATLVTVGMSRPDKNTRTAFRAAMDSFAFGSPLRLPKRLDSAKPLVVPAGADSFSAIGAVRGGGGSVSSASDVREELKAYAAAFESMFGEPPPEDEEKEEEETEGGMFAEAEVDAMRALKEQELQRYRKEIERKARLGGASRTKKKKKDTRRRAAAGAATSAGSAAS